MVRRLEWLLYLGSVLALNLLFPFASSIPTLQQTPLRHSSSQAKPPPPRSFLTTAVLSHTSPPHHAYLACLNVTSSPFHTYPTVGTSAFLSTATNVTYVVLPPHSEEGWHRPPAPMWFVLLRGKARVWTPLKGDEVWIEPPAATGLEAETDDRGERASPSTVYDRQIVLALDVLGKGHLTFYPGDEQTVALQVPLGEGLGGLEWEFVGEGAC